MAWHLWNKRIKFEIYESLIKDYTAHSKLKTIIWLHYNAKVNNNLNHISYFLIKKNWLFSFKCILLLNARLNSKDDTYVVKLNSFTELKKIIKLGRLT